MKYIILLSVLFFVSCTRNKSEKADTNVQNSELYTIPVADLKFQIDFGSKIDVSPYIKSIKYVKLEMTDESMIGGIYSMEAFEDKLYILDDVTRNVYVFSIEGDFLFVLNKVGQGPGEYAQIDFFSIDRNERQMIVADLVSYNILRYDLDGNFVSKQKVDYQLDGIYPIEDKSFIALTNYQDNSEKIENQHNILFLDSMSNITCGYFPYPSKDISKIRFSISSGNAGFYYGGNCCNYFNKFQDTVYSVSNNTLTPKYVFDFGDKKFDESYLANDIKILKDYIKRGEYMSLYDMNETDDYVFYGIGYGGIYNGLFSKKTEKNLVAQIWYNGEDQMVGFPIAAHKSSLIHYVPVSSLLDKKEKYNKDGWPEGKFIEQEKEFINTLSEEDNIVLIFYEFDNI